MNAWKRNLYILMVCQFLVFGSMSMVMPFLPLYLKELGLEGQETIQFWAGIIFGVNFLSQFLVAPLWGSLGDRYGRKIMVLRSGFGMSVILCLTAMVTNHWQLLALRMLNGLVSGFIPASVSLVATNTPKENVGRSLGMLQSGAVGGSIMGPFIGGILAEIVGFRQIFFLTAAVLCLATLVVLVAVREEFKPEGQNRTGGLWQSGKRILRDPRLQVLFSVAFLLQFAMLGPMPMMSLFVEDLGVPGGYVAFFAGLVAAAMGAANMLASPLLGRWGDRIGSGRVLLYAMIGAALIFVPHAMVLSVWQLLALRFLLGLCAGGLLPSLNAMIRRLAPQGMESTAYGFSTSAVSLGNMLGPVTYGYLSGIIGIRGVFLLTAGLLAANAVWLGRSLKKRASSEADGNSRYRSTA
ncbi:MFS transporter [Staphylospora marina]|uniref:MFS transporter n=1 Tax=Staphylospora marina TaxID=2490858 RepID=UPI000F5B9703|nr:MFS transporter [Staphylospora marina]